MRAAPYSPAWSTRIIRATRCRVVGSPGRLLRSSVMVAVFILRLWTSSLADGHGEASGEYQGIEQVETGQRDRQAGNREGRLVARLGWACRHRGQPLRDRPAREVRR